MLNNKVMVNEKVKSGINPGLLLQLVASVSWIISVIVYGSYELGDCLQLLAASAWTVSNILSFFAENNISYGKEREFNKHVQSKNLQ